MIRFEHPSSQRDSIRFYISRYKIGRYKLATILDAPYGSLTGLFLLGKGLPDEVLYNLDLLRALTKLLINLYDIDSVGAVLRNFNGSLRKQQLGKTVINGVPCNISVLQFVNALEPVYHQATPFFPKYVARIRK